MLVFLLGFAVHELVLGCHILCAHLVLFTVHQALLEHFGCEQGVVFLSRCRLHRFLVGLHLCFHAVDLRLESQDVAFEELDLLREVMIDVRFTRLNLFFRKLSVFVHHCQRFKPSVILSTFDRI